ncbi:MAG TPA: flagellar basal body P-ring formation chaperone FlgA [Fibrobacteria bacterium]|nr:flagellar basal body P-ring formation chaperone FlgA [Fibrobacteria bacterium]
MTVCGLLLLVAGLRADGIRQRADSIYRALQTPSMRVVADTSGLPGSVAAPPGAVGWELVRDGGPRPEGTEVLCLDWTRSDGSVLHRAWLTVRVRREELEAVALRRMERGEIPDSSSFKWEWRETSGSVPPPPDAARIGHLRLRIGTGPGQILTSRQLEPPPLVSQGQEITVRSSQAGATASVEGIAQSDGSAGSRILVLSPWGRRIRCLVLDDGSTRSLE